MRKWVNLLINTVSPGLHYLAYRICYLVYYAPGTGRSIAQWRPQERCFHPSANHRLAFIPRPITTRLLWFQASHSAQPLGLSWRARNTPQTLFKDLPGVGGFWEALCLTIKGAWRSSCHSWPEDAACVSQRLGAAAASSPCGSSGCSSPMNPQTRNPRTKSSTLGRTGGKGRKILGPWRYRELRCRTGRRSFFLILEAMSHLMASPLSVRRSTTWG